VAQPLTVRDMAKVPEQNLANLSLDEAGGCQPNDEIAPRAYPYPFLSALALSNDCDSQSVECMMDWHSFVNGRLSTPYGDGLGLEVGDSFWIYGNGVEPAIFKGNPFDHTLSDGYALQNILTLGKLGWMDTLHSFGNWTKRFVPTDMAGDPSIFARDQILRGLDRLNELDLKPYVYTNHSGSPSNVGGPWKSNQHLDDPAHNIYAFDALKEFGFRFFWIDACTDIEKFGNDLNFTSDQELARSIEQFQWAPWLRRRDDENRPIPITLPEGQDQRRQFLTNLFNHSLFPVPAQDGSLLNVFKRYRDIEQPVGSIFSSQVTAAKLNELEQRGGSVIIYQHFGVFGPRGRAPAISRPHRKRSPVPALDIHSVATWRLIADRASQQRLFVTTLGRLLDWIWRRDALRYEVEQMPDKTIIRLRHFACEVEGIKSIEASDLNGLAFSVPSANPDIEVYWSGSSTPLTMKRKRESPSNGEFDVVYLEWQKLEWPDGD
jgi:hypothetical protein